MQCLPPRESSVNMSHLLWLWCRPYLPFQVHLSLCCPSIFHTFLTPLLIYYHHMHMSSIPLLLYLHSLYICMDLFVIHAFYLVSNQLFSCFSPRLIAKINLQPMTHILVTPSLWSSHPALGSIPCGCFHSPPPLKNEPLENCGSVFICLHLPICPFTPSWWSSRIS